MVLNFLKILLFSLMLISCSQPDLKFTGNLSTPLSMNETSDLRTFLKDNGIEAEYALLCGKDGTATYVFKKSFPEIDLVKEGVKWNSVTEKLPEVCNIKDLANICLFIRNPENKLFFLNHTDQKKVITPFEAELSQYEFLGQSRKNGHSARKYKFSHNFKLQSEADSILAIYKDGTDKWLYPNEDGVLDNMQLEENYFVNVKDTVITLWEDPPATDAYSLHENIRNRSGENKNLYIFLDSYGWLYREHLKSIKHEGFLAQFDLKPLRVPYPPKTMNSFWIIGSGTSWQKRDNSDEYFTDILRHDQKGVIIEADKLFYPSPIKQILHTDKNHNGTIDDEIFIKTMELLDTDLDLIVTHFHSLDDIGHETGAYSRDRLNTFIVLEDYIEQIFHSWTGDIYLFSDHGMHSEGNTGKHIYGSAEDIVGVWGKLK